MRVISLSLSLSLYIYIYIYITFLFVHFLSAPAIFCLAATHRLPSFISTIPTRAFSTSASARPDKPLEALFDEADQDPSDAKKQSALFEVRWISSKRMRK